MKQKKDNRAEYSGRQGTDFGKVGRKACQKAGAAGQACIREKAGAAGQACNR